MLKMSWCKKRRQIAKIAKTFGAINTGRAYTKAVPIFWLQVGLYYIIEIFWLFWLNILAILYSGLYYIIENHG